MTHFFEKIMTSGPNFGGMVTQWALWQWHNSSKKVLSCGITLVFVPDGRVFALLFFAKSTIINAFL